MVLKRKSAHSLCIDPKKASGPKKPPTKAEIQEELKMTNNTLKMTKELNDALLEEVGHNEAKITALENKNEKNNSIIVLLEERVNILERNSPESKTDNVHTFVHTGSQTEDEDILFCQECEYPANDRYSLGEHMGEFHTENLVEDFPSQDILTEHKAMNPNDEVARPKHPNAARNNFKFTCKYCEEVFELKRDLMKHSKMEHTKSLSICWNFEAGCCEYEDSFCWFAHENTKVITGQYS